MTHPLKLRRFFFKKSRFFRFPFFERLDLFYFVFKSDNSKPGYFCTSVRHPPRSPPPLRPRNPPPRRLRHKGPRRPGLPRRGRRRRVCHRLGNEPPSPPRGQAASASAPKIQTSIFCTGVVSEIQNSSKFGFFGLSANEQLRFFKILEYTGRYGFPEILIEVRVHFWSSPNARRMFAKSEEKTLHRFGIVVLKTGLSVSRPIENSGVEWV
jgi:hypothetical protein